MPGILPMKVIKVGPSAQARIAQACDRCRSKKIRCDGVRPCCSQCSSVGFECKTSDKLSRRAFPRGYTESLEERVRALESEVRELKDLLDEKDEKIDMLSRMHSNRRPSMPISPGIQSDSTKEETCSPPKDDIFRVQASPLLVNGDNSNLYFMGASSGRAFIDAFKRKIQEAGKSIDGLNTDTFLSTQREPSNISRVSTPTESTAPPRMFSDRCVNIFFQEWAPLFPVLHKPSFLRLYEDYVSQPDEMTDPHSLAQLHLVFGIAGISSNIPEQEAIASCGQQWQSSLDSILMDNTIATLQCLVLALIHCTLSGDYNRLQHYKGTAIGLALRLGLHQSQKRFSFGALTTETRKKVFWTLYTIDCFSAAVLGLPKSLKEEDIHAEYPSDTDDEYVTEQGFSPTLPGEYTRISAALALFRASRILAKVLEQNYPSAASHDLSLQSLTTLDEDLKDWSDELPVHLKLTFAQDKPSTDVTGNRSALLSLAYYYIRSLIHRPAVGSTLGRKSSPSVITLAESSKHIIQIVQLLEERSMSFSFCVNKNEMLVLCGLSLLYQGLDLKQEGKLMQDSQKLVLAVVKLLEKAEAPAAPDFRKLASSILKLDAKKPTPSRDMAAPLSTTPSLASAAKLNKHPIYRMQTCSISESELLDQQEKLRRATLPNLAINRRPAYVARASVDNLRSETPLAKREHRASAPALSHIRPRPNANENPPNLDYLSLNNTQAPMPIRPPSQPRAKHSLGVSGGGPVYPTPVYAAPKTNMVSPSEWETILGSLDGGQTNLYDAIYGGPPLSLTDGMPTTAYGGDWSPDGWDMRSLTMNECTDNGIGAAHSVLSFSDESLTSGEDLGTSDLGLGLGTNDYKLPVVLGSGDGYFWDGFDETFGL